MDLVLHSASTDNGTIIFCNEECSVCGDVADGYHYGVLSCRGCNAFFRRAITYGMLFSCRRGGNCLVDKNGRCSCRACRLKKCEEMGMDRRAVQPKREHLTRRKAASENNPEKASIMGSAKSSAEPSPANDCIGSSPESGFQAADMKYYLQTSPSTSNETSQGVIATLISDYREQCKRRRMMLCSTVEEILAEDDNVSLKHPASGADYVAIFKVQMILMFEWANKLPEFRMLENALDKMKLLRAFALRYMLLDNVFYTVELKNCSQIVFVNNSYITPGHIPPFFPGEDADSGMVKLLMYGDSSFHVIEELIAPMIEMQFTTGEMMALRLIVFWNPGGTTLSDEGNRIVQLASDAAIRELHRWYEEQNIQDVDSRLSNLLLLLPSFAEHAQNIFEIVKLISSFGTMNEWDSFMSDIISF